MDDGRVFLADRPLNVYTTSQVRDVLEEARRLECMTRSSCGILDTAVRKLDSLNCGRMDT